MPIPGLPFPRPRQGCRPHLWNPSRLLDPVLLQPVPPRPRPADRTMMKNRSLPYTLGTVLLIFAGVFWLRGATFGGNLWNVDESIHAAAARTILDGGVLYRDACDIRNPLSYYAFAAVFAVAGENNLAAVRLLVALLIAATAVFLYFSGRALRRPLAGLAAAGLFTV